MECRICHQPIVFVRGRFPHRTKTTTLAVHESESASLLQHPNSFLTNPHPGAQRKLRQALEEEHTTNTANNDQLNETHLEPPAESAQPAPVQAYPGLESVPDTHQGNPEVAESEKAAAATNAFD
jgi:hypothetical protein